MINAFIFVIFLVILIIAIPLGIFFIIKYLIRYNAKVKKEMNTKDL